MSGHPVSPLGPRMQENITLEPTSHPRYELCMPGLTKIGGQTTNSLMVPSSRPF